MKRAQGAFSVFACGLVCGIALSACQITENKAPINRSFATGGGQKATGGIIPIKVPDTSGGGGGSSGPGVTDPVATIKSLAASEFPTNTHNSPIQLSGTVAKMSLKVPRKLVGELTDEVIVNVRRWGPFSATTGIPNLISLNASKFICPTQFAKAGDELVWDLIPQGSARFSEEYIKQFAVNGIEATTGASHTFIPATVAWFTDANAVPNVEMKAGFEYDGDRNLDGAITGTNGANLATRRELRLVPDATYVYIFCIGKLVNNEYSWAIQEKKVFRPVDLEKPKAPLALKDQTGQVYTNNKPVLVQTSCIDQNQETQRRGELIVNINLSGLDSSIGRRPDMAHAAVEDVIEMHYITELPNSGIHFLDSPTGYRISDETSTTAVIGTAHPTLDPKGMLVNNFGISGGTMKIINTVALKKASDALTDLITTGQGTFRFLTNYYNPKDTTSSIDSLYANTLAKDYAGGSLTGQSQVKIAFEIAIRDRSFENSSSFSSIVFGQPFSALIFAGAVELPKMPGATFLRGETTNTVSYLSGVSSVKTDPHISTSVCPNKDY